jgi:inorganic pyrophosphatase
MSNEQPAEHPIQRIPAVAVPGDDVHVVIDTPRGSRNKYAFEPALGVFALRHVLPAGAVFPFDFGFVPGTLGDDGDPLDVLVLLDDAAFAGCLVRSRLIGVIEAEQAQDGRSGRNDRLVAVASASRSHAAVRELAQVDGAMLDEVERFFVSYNDARGRRFTPLGRHGAERARALVDAGIARARRQAAG